MDPLIKSGDDEEKKGAALILSVLKDERGFAYDILSHFSFWGERNEVRGLCPRG